MWTNIERSSVNVYSKHIHVHVRIETYSNLGSFSVKLPATRLILSPTPCFLKNTLQGKT